MSNLKIHSKNLNGLIFDRKIFIENFVLNKLEREKYKEIIDNIDWIFLVATSKILSNRHF